MAWLSPFLLLCLVGFTTFFGSYLRIPVLPLFAADLGAGPAAVGFINGAFMVTAGVLSIPGGLLGDLVGRRRCILAGIAAIALSSLIVSRCSHPGQVALAYILFGAGMAGFAPGMLSLVADVVPAGRLGQAYGWYTTAVYGAMTLGPAAGGYIGHRLGLRPVFLVSGAILSLVALLALFVLPRTGRRHAVEFRSVLAASARLVGNRQLLGCLAATVGSCVVFGVFLTFLPLYAASKGFDPARAGLVFAAQALTNVGVRIPVGAVADRWDRCRIVAVGILCLATAITLLGRVVQLEYLLATAVLLGIGMALVFTAIGALIAELVPALQRGLAMGMYNSCIYLGMMVGSASMGMVVAAVGYGVAFSGAGGVAVVTMVLFLALTARGGAALPD